MSSFTERRTGRPTTMESATLRQAILDQTLDALQTVGSEGLSIDRLAARINVTKRTIYRHFKNKAGLIDAVVTRKLKSLNLVIAGPEEEAGPPSENALSDLQRWAHAIFLYVHTPEHRAFACYIEFEAGHDPEIAAHFDRWCRNVFDRGCGLIAAAQDEGTIAPGSPTRLTLLLFDLILGREGRGRSIDPAVIFGGDTPEAYFRLRWLAFVSLATHHALADLLAEETRETPPVRPEADPVETASGLA